VAISADKGGCEFLLNDEITISNSGIAVPVTGVEITPLVKPMVKDDYLDIEGTSTLITDVTFIITDTESNHVIGSFIFESIAPKVTGPTPTFQLRVDDLDDRLVVTSADTSADWNRLALKTNQANVKFNLNAEVTAYAGFVMVNIDTLYEICAVQDLMGATEHIDFEGNGGIINDVSITVVDTTANQEIGTYQFISIAALS
jgi:hypothetical protein